MIPPDKLRALLSDHPPQAYMSKDQEKIRDVWDAAREMLEARERPQSEDFIARKWGDWWSIQTFGMDGSSLVYGIDMRTGEVMLLPDERCPLAVFTSGTRPPT